MGGKMRFYCKCGKRLTYLQWLEGHCKPDKKIPGYYGAGFCSISEKPTGKDYSIVLNKRNSLKKVDKELMHHNIKWDSDLHTFLDLLWEHSSKGKGEDDE